MIKQLTYTTWDIFTYKKIPIFCIVGEGGVTKLEVNELNRTAKIYYEGNKSVFTGNLENCEYE